MYNNSFPRNIIKSINKIKIEIEIAKNIFKKYNWPIIDVTRKSVEGSGFAIAVKITDTSTNIPWSIRGFQLEFVPGGRR